MLLRFKQPVQTASNVQKSKFWSIYQLLISSNYSKILTTDTKKWLYKSYLTAACTHQLNEQIKERASSVHFPITDLNAINLSQQPHSKAEGLMKMKNCQSQNNVWVPHLYTFNIFFQNTQLLLDLLQLLWIREWEKSKSICTAPPPR